MNHKCCLHNRSDTLVTNLVMACSHKASHRLTHSLHVSGHSCCVQSAPRSRSYQRRHTIRCFNCCMSCRTLVAMWWCSSQCPLSSQVPAFRHLGSCLSTNCIVAFGLLGCRLPSNCIFAFRFLLSTNCMLPFASWAVAFLPTAFLPVSH